MLTRQRLLLTLLSEAPGPVQATSLVKWAFLLGEESAVGDDPTYYRFVPYKYGPFSFALYQELHALERQGLVVMDGERIAVAADRGAELLEASRALPVEATLAAAAVVREYGALVHDDLLRSVYARHPWYTLNTERPELCSLPRPPRTRAALAVYTAGYHEETIDAFLDRMLRRGVARIADVRANPMSRKYGFAGSRLRDLAGKVGLSYSHFPRLGVPSSYRRRLETPSDYDALFRVYEGEMLPTAAKEIDAVAGLCASEPTALLCAEANPRFCHRSVLAEHVAARSGLEVAHL